nr:MAG TPA: hypothetical protein [Caudoviricetes sp.]
MDYTKILSALKGVLDTLEDDIGAVNASVSGIPGALDTQFTAVKNDIAAVKTDVGGVKSDVADVKQAIVAANTLADQINGEVI